MPERISRPPGSLNNATAAIWSSALSLQDPLFDQTHTPTAIKGHESAQHDIASHALADNLHLAHPYTLQERCLVEYAHRPVHSHFQTNPDFSTVIDHAVNRVMDKPDNAPENALARKSQVTRFLEPSSPCALEVLIYL